MSKCLLFPALGRFFYLHPLNFVTAYLDDRNKIFLFFPTEEIAVDSRSCLCWGTRTLSCLWPVTNVFQLNMRWAGVQLCFFASDIIHIFSVVFHVVRTAHKFDFRLVMKAVTNKWWPVERKSWSNRDIFERIYICIFHLDRRQECPGTLPTLCRSTVFS